MKNPILYLMSGFISLTVIILGFFFTEKPLHSVDKYKIYYGEINNTILEHIINYDMVILEAANLTKEQVKYIKKQKKTITLGYLSVMEIGDWDKEINEKLYDSDYLYLDGRKVRDKYKKNYIGNLGQTHFRNILLSVLEKRILYKGFDGIFIDTTGWIDSLENRNKELYKQQLDGYEELLKKITREYPGIIIVQNRGFSCFKLMSSNYVNGILWENFDIKSISSEDIKNNELINELEQIRFTKCITIFSVSYQNENENQEFARKMQWIHLQQNESTHHNKWILND